MADPFEVRMRFTSQLQHLNASATSAQKAALYALKHREMDEDLHSCILEQLERNNMNNRANIMYFFEALCDRASAEKHDGYISMMQRDMFRIVDLVAPDDGSGAANLKVVRRVLGALAGKGFVSREVRGELEACLTEREEVAVGVDGAEDEISTTRPAAAQGGSSATRRGSGHGRAHGNDDANTTNSHHPSGRTHGNPSITAASRGTTSTHPSTATSTPRLDKRQIEQRIEEDRERHKRLRESMWAVGAGGVLGAGPAGKDEDWTRLIADAGMPGRDDEVAAREESEERAKCRRVAAV